MRLFVSILLGWACLSVPALQAQVNEERVQPGDPPAAPTAPDSDPERSETRTSRRDDSAYRFRNIQGPILFANFVLRTNEACRDLVVIGGNVEIAGTVEGSLVVIGGKAKITGTVEQETVIVLGGADIADSARLERETVFIGGPFNIAEGAELSEEAVLIPFGDVAVKMEWFKSWLFNGLLMGRLLATGVAWPWITAAFFAFLYLIMLLVFPAAIKATVRALEERPVTSLAVGVLILTLLAPLIFLLAISVVGIVVIPFVLLAFVLLVLFGKASVICLLGRGIARSSRFTALENLLPAFFVGLILITIAYAIPVLGLLAWAVGTVFGLGAAVVALSGTFQREDSTPRTAVAMPAPPLAAATPVTAQSAPPSGGIAVPMTAASLTATDTVLLPRAGFWKRVAAALLDLVLLAMLVPLLKGWIILIAVCYFVGMWTWKGTTIGSIVLGLKIVRTDGTPVSFAVALVRSLSSVFSAMCLFLGFLWAAWDVEKQAWHDKIAGTVVVRMPRDFALV